MAWLDLGIGGLSGLISTRGVRLDLADRLVLPDGPVEIGFRPASVPHVGLDFPQISRRHCLLEPRAGRWGVSDLGASWGTFVGGQQVDGWTAVAAGCVVRLGDRILRLFEVAATPAAAAAIAAGRVEAALAALCADWRRLPTPRRGDWIESLGEAVTDPRLVARLASADAWSALARAPGPVAIGPLLRAAERAPERLEAQLTAMAGWAPDPRVTRWLLTVPAERDRAWRAASKAHEIVGIPRKARIEEDFDAFLAWLRPATPTDALSEALEAQVSADPDRDEPLLVLADWWQQRGDPRGASVALGHDQRTRLAALRRRFRPLWDAA